MRNGKRPFIFYQLVVCFAENRENVKCVHLDRPFKGGAQDYTAWRDFVLPRMAAGETLEGDAGYRHGKNEGILVAPGGRSANMTKEQRLLAALIHTGRQLIERYFARVKAMGFNSRVWRHSHNLHYLLMRVLVQVLNMGLKEHPL